MSAELHITLDTEPDCDVKWNRTNPLQYTSITEGVPQFYRPIWDKHKVSPIYFISPEILWNKAAVETLKSEVQKGAIIGTHLHSEYIEPNQSLNAETAGGHPSNEFPCYAHDTQIEHEKLANFTVEITKTFGIKPEWYRAARYGADLDTIKALKALGYKYDTSVTPHINWKTAGGPDHTTAPEQPYWISKDDYYKGTSEAESIGIKEFPITIGSKRLGPLGNLLPENWLMYNWLRPTHVFTFEQKQLVDQYFKKYKSPTFIMMFHSMEVMINKSPYVRNKFMQDAFISRIDKMIGYIKEHS